MVSGSGNGHWLGRSFFVSLIFDSGYEGEQQRKESPALAK
jgi:hypothetical protein